MYEQVFQFNSRPFTSTPYVKHYFAGDAIHSALGQARVAIDRASGPAVVVGGTGTGKSLLLAMLEDQYQSQFNVVNLACARLDNRRELLQSILFELQLPFKAEHESDLRFELMDFLSPSEQCPNGMLLLVDEAHSLSTELLDELRLIMNFVRDGLPRVRLVMAGSQKLEENLNDPKLESFNQRIAARCYLQTMSRDETSAYVTEHIDRVGGNGAALFDQDSIKVIHEVTDGCPRLINQVCDQALILVATHGHETASTDCIHDAWSDVQSIPGSRKMTSPEQQNEAVSSLNSDEKWTVIEFGQLEDEPEEVESSQVEPTDSHTDVSDTSDIESEQACDDFEPEPCSELGIDEDKIGYQFVEPTEGNDEIASELPTTVPEEFEQTIESTHLDPSSDESPQEVESFVGWQPEPVEEEESVKAAANDEVDSLINFDPSNDQQLDSAETLDADPIIEPLDTISLEQSDTAVETETTRDMAAELAAVFGGTIDDPISDEEATSSSSIDDLTLEQEQIVEQVQEEQENIFGGIGTASNELEGEVIGVVDEHGETHSNPSDHENALDDQAHLETKKASDGPDDTQTVHASQYDVNAETTKGEDLLQDADTPRLRQPVETEDPFDESFAEEENLIDRFAPFVAHQNQSSLSVTSDHLSMLTPNDEVESSEEPMHLSMNVVSDESNSLENANPSDEHLPNTVASVDIAEDVPPGSIPIEIETVSPDASIVDMQATDEVQAFSGHFDDAEESEPATESLLAPASETEISENTQPKVHEHVSEASSTDVQKQAEEILKRLNISKSVSHETTESSESQSQTTGLNHPTPTNLSEPESGSDFDRQNAALDESQQILNEILEQKNALAQQREEMASEPSSNNTPLDESTRKDDREMIIVNQMEQAVEKAKPDETHVPFPSTPVSTGRAQRMDYQKLFDQLRDISSTED